MSGLFSSPKAPKVAAVIDEDAKAKEALAKELKETRKRKGRLSTILTTTDTSGGLKSTFGG